MYIAPLLPPLQKYIKIRVYAFETNDIVGTWGGGVVVKGGEDSKYTRLNDTLSGVHSKKFDIRNLSWRKSFYEK